MKHSFLFHGLNPEQAEILFATRQHEWHPFSSVHRLSKGYLVDLPDDPIGMPRRLYELSRRSDEANVVQATVSGTIDLFEYGKERIMRPLATLKDFEDWVGERWVYPVGTNEAFSHFQKKLAEELDELTEAVQGSDKDSIMGELGDVMYCMFAQARALGICLNDELRLHKDICELYDYTGTIPLRSASSNPALFWHTLSQKPIDGVTDEDIGHGVAEFNTAMCVETAHRLADVQASAARIFRSGLTKFGESYAREPYMQIKAGRVEGTAFDILRYAALVAEYFGKDIHYVIGLVQQKQLHRISAGKQLTRLVIDTNPR